MQNRDEYFLKMAIEVAKESRQNGNEPFGAILVKDDVVVMVGKNEINTFSDPTHHAEIGLIRSYCREYGVSDLSELTLYSSCEPCVMCSGAMVWSQLGKLVFSVSHDQLAEIAGSNIMIGSDEVFEKSPHQPQVVKMMLNDEGLEVFKNYHFK